MDSRQRGVTLMEMLIVITIVGLMTAVAVPFYLRETPGEAVTRASHDLAQAIRVARYRAISLNRQVYVDLEAGGKDRFYTAYVNLGDPDDVPTGTAGEIGEARIPSFGDVGVGQIGVLLPDNVDFALGNAPDAPGGSTPGSALDLPANPLVLQPKGTVVWPAAGLVEGTIFLSYSDRPEIVRAVTIGRTGVVRVWSLWGGEWQ